VYAFPCLNTQVRLHGRGSAGQAPNARIHGSRHDGGLGRCEHEYTVIGGLAARKETTDPRRTGSRRRRVSSNLRQTQIGIYQARLGKKRQAVFPRPDELQTRCRMIGSGSSYPVQSMLRVPSAFSAIAGAGVVAPDQVERTPTHPQSRPVAIAIQFSPLVRRGAGVAAQERLPSSGRGARE